MTDAKSLFLPPAKPSFTSKTWRDEPKRPSLRRIC
jgi:hypothetical protein